MTDLERIAALRQALSTVIYLAHNADEQDDYLGTALVLAVCKIALAHDAAIDMHRIATGGK